MTSPSGDSPSDTGLPYDGLITVSACKFDGAEHRRWHARLIRRADSLLVLDARFEEEVRHSILGTLERGTLSIEYYWLDRYYNIFRFLTPARQLLYYYCNVNLPPRFDGKVLSYIDLDMDILVAPDMTYKILDEEEFQTNADLFDYPCEIRSRAHAALCELMAMIESRQYPFNGQV